MGHRYEKGTFSQKGPYDTGEKGPSETREDSRMFSIPKKKTVVGDQADSGGRDPRIAERVSRVVKRKKIKFVVPEKGGGGGG